MEVLDGRAMPSGLAPMGPPPQQVQQAFYDAASLGLQTTPPPQQVQQAFYDAASLGLLAS
jgi:hypothetical protein